MIKASYINNILETYLETVHAYDRSPVEVFVNPSKKELIKDVGKDIKFICDATTKQLYAWNEKAFHHDVMAALHIQPNKVGTIYYKGRSFDISIDFFQGYGERSGNTYRITSLDPIDYINDKFKLVAKSSRLDYDDLSRLVTLATSICDEDWSWVDRYVDMTEYMVEFKQALEDAKGRLEKKI
jgi:hypothetical protein